VVAARGTGGASKALRATSNAARVARGMVVRPFELRAAREEGGGQRAARAAGGGVESGGRAAEERARGEMLPPCETRNAGGAKRRAGGVDGRGEGRGIRRGCWEERQRRSGRAAATVGEERGVDGGGRARGHKRRRRLVHLLLLYHNRGCEVWVCSQDRGAYRSVRIRVISSIWLAPPPEEVLGKSTIWPRFDHIDSRSTVEDPEHRGRYAAERRYVSLSISMPYRPESSIVTPPIVLIESVPHRPGCLETLADQDAPGDAKIEPDDVA
jgi:hypothetical protein